MANRLQDWIYEKGGYFWFRKWSHREAERKGRFVWNGVRWKWLVRVLRIITGRKFSYWKTLREKKQELLLENARIVAEIENERDALCELVKLVYRKHHLGDETIGWNELSDMLCDGLCNTMGDTIFQEWLQSLKSSPNVRQKRGDT